EVVPWPPAVRGGSTAGDGGERRRGPGHSAARHPTDRRALPSPPHRPRRGGTVAGGRHARTRLRPEDDGRTDRDTDRGGGAPGRTGPPGTPHRRGRRWLRVRQRAHPGSPLSDDAWSNADPAPSARRGAPRRQPRGGRRTRRGGRRLGAGRRSVAPGGRTCVAAVLEPRRGTDAGPG